MATATTPSSSRGRWLWLAAGLLLGQALGPVVAWAAERVEVNWPSVFRIEANRELPVRVDRPVRVEMQRSGIPTFSVKVEGPVEVRGNRSTDVGLSAPAFTLLRSTNEATWFVAAGDVGGAVILRWDHFSNQVSRVTNFGF